MNRKLYLHISYFFDDSSSNATSNLQTLGYSFQSQMGESSLLKLETGIEWGEKKLVKDKPEEIRPAWHYPKSENLWIRPNKNWGWGVINVKVHRCQFGLWNRDRSQWKWHLYNVSWRTPKTGAYRQVIKFFFKC